jgi:hypothetical protein
MKFSFFKSREYIIFEPRGRRRIIMMKKIVTLSAAQVMELTNAFKYDGYDEIVITGELSEEDLKKFSEMYVEQLLERGVKGSDVNLASFKEQMDDMIETMAKNAHQRWLDAKASEGMKEGDDPDFTEWENLSDHAKEMNRSTARESLRQLEMLGLVPIKTDKIVEAIAIGIHDNWVIDTVKGGYIWGAVKNKDASKGPLTHRDLLPFWMLKAIYPEDIRYDMDTAQGSLDSVVQAGYALAAA